MRLALHDYPGHAFPIQLSRALAARGHQVLHLTFEAHQSPKGPLARRADDPPSLAIEGVAMARGYARYKYLSRALNEARYGRALAARVAAFRPDVVIGGNAPLDPQARLHAEARRLDAGFVFWVQDFYGVAIDRILTRQLPLVGAAIGWRYRRLERRLWRGSDRLIAITDDFLPLLLAAGVGRARIEVIENWAPSDEITPQPRDNAWARAHGLADRRVLLYAGTLGLKHNPALLADLAEAFRPAPDVRVVVVTQGLGRTWLEAAKSERGLTNLDLLDFQPHAMLPEALGSAAVMLVLLEADAAAYSVPSKVLSYLCAGRPILAAVPAGNLAARIIERAGAGRVVAPDDGVGLVAAARALLDDPGRAEAMAAGGRAYALRRFDIAAIADRFERILVAAAADAGRIVTPPTIPAAAYPEPA